MMSSSVMTMPKPSVRPSLMIIGPLAWQDGLRKLKVER